MLHCVTPKMLQETCALCVVADRPLVTVQAIMANIAIATHGNGWLGSLVLHQARVDCCRWTFVEMAAIFVRIDSKFF